MRATFYFDLGSPYSYLASERISGLFGEAGLEQPEWKPVLLGAIHKAANRRSPALEPNADEFRAEIERRAVEYGLQPFRWPQPFPPNTLTAMRAATYAKQIGRTVSFAQAAFRQAFAGGRDLTELDNVIVAAAACEIHPRALTVALERQALKDTLRATTEEAIEAGVIGVPTVAIGDQLFWGDDRLEEAVGAALASG